MSQSNGCDVTPDKVMGTVSNGLNNTDVMELSQLREQCFNLTTKLRASEAELLETRSKLAHTQKQYEKSQNDQAQFSVLCPSESNFVFFLKGGTAPGNRQIAQRNACS